MMRKYSHPHQGYSYLPPPRAHRVETERQGTPGGNTGAMYLGVDFSRGLFMGCAHEETTVAYNTGNEPAKRNCIRYQLTCVCIRARRQNIVKTVVVIPTVRVGGTRVRAGTMISWGCRTRTSNTAVRTAFDKACIPLQQGGMSESSRGSTACKKMGEVRLPQNSKNKM